MSATPNIVSSAAPPAASFDLRIVFLLVKKK
jgi:hypothetical protein